MWKEWVAQWGVTKKAKRRRGRQRTLREEALDRGGRERAGPGILLCAFLRLKGPGGKVQSMSGQWYDVHGDMLRRDNILGCPDKETSAGDAQRRRSSEAGCDPIWLHCSKCQRSLRLQRFRMEFQENSKIILFIYHRMEDYTCLVRTRHAVCARALLVFLLACVCSLLLNAEHRLRTLSNGC